MRSVAKRQTSSPPRVHALDHKIALFTISSRCFRPIGRSSPRRHDRRKTFCRRYSVRSHRLSLRLICFVYLVYLPHPCVGSQSRFHLVSVLGVGTPSHLIVVGRSDRRSHLTGFGLCLCVFCGDRLIVSVSPYLRIRYQGCITDIMGLNIIFWDYETENEFP